MSKTDRKIRYAVVGAGWISQGAFMPGVAQTSNSVLAAVVTGDPEKAKELGRRYNIAGYSYNEYDDLLSSGSIDAVYVATPNFRHREFAVPALEAGIHVLLEKPMAGSLEDAQAIQEAAEKSNAKLMIAYRLHCEPGTLAMLETVRSGEIGTPRFFTSAFSQTVKASNHRAKSGYWAGPVPDMGTYPINAVRNLFQAEPLTVMAIGSRTERALDCDDTVSVILGFPDNRSASFTLSYSAASIDQLHLVGSKGAIEAEPVFGFGEGVSIDFRLIRGGNTEERKAPVVDQFGGETEYFSHCILEDLDPEPDGEEGLLDMIVLAAIERALDTSQMQTLEPRSRNKAIASDQKRELPLAEVPEFVNAEVPVG